MLVRYQRALAGYIGGIILAAALMYGALNVRTLTVVVFSLLGIVIAIIAGWYALKR